MVGLGQERGCMRVGGICLKYLKGGGTEKRGGETKILKRGGKLGQGVGALKRRARTLLRIMLKIKPFRKTN